jgi:hypothetical protein
MALVDGKSCRHRFSDTEKWSSFVIQSVCPGLHLANHSLYITLAFLLWSFRIVQRPDAPIDTNAFSDTVTPHAAPFEIDVIPRVEVEKLRAMMTDGCTD